MGALKAPLKCWGVCSAIVATDSPISEQNMPLGCKCAWCFSREGRITGPGRFWKIFGATFGRRYSSE